MHDPLSTILIEGAHGLPRRRGGHPPSCPTGSSDETLAITAVRSPRMRWHARFSAQRTGVRPGRSCRVGPSVAIAFVLLALLVALLALGLGWWFATSCAQVGRGAESRCIGRRSLRRRLPRRLPSPRRPSHPFHPCRSRSPDHESSRVRLRTETSHQLPSPKVSGAGSMVAFTSIGRAPRTRRSSGTEHLRIRYMGNHHFLGPRPQSSHPCPLVNGGQSRVSDQRAGGTAVPRRPSHHRGYRVRRASR